MTQEGVRESGLTAIGDDPILAEIVARIVPALHPQRIYLFGSQARGDAGSDSDYDILVVVKERSGPGYATERVAYRALRGLGAPVDVLVVTVDRFERRSSVIASLPATVLREGKLLYAA